MHRLSHHGTGLQAGAGFRLYDELPGRQRGLHRPLRQLLERLRQPKRDKNQRR